MQDVSKLKLQTLDIVPWVKTNVNNHIKGFYFFSVSACLNVSFTIKLIILRRRDKNRPNLGQTLFLVGNFVGKHFKYKKIPTSHGPTRPCTGMKHFLNW